MSTRSLLHNTSLDIYTEVTETYPFRLILGLKKTVPVLVHMIRHSPGLNAILCLIGTKRRIGNDLFEKLDTVGFFRDVSPVT